SARPAAWRRGMFVFTEPENDRATYVQAVIDLRRGVDLLAARPEVDAKRLGFVGFSFGATLGGILAGVERRIKAYALMGTAARLTDFWRSGEQPDLVKLRASLTKEQLDKYIATTAPFDTIHYIGRAAPAAVLFQFGRRDENVPEKLALEFYQAGSKPKEIKWWDGGHELNDEALRHRAEWFRSRLGIAALGGGASGGRAQVATPKDVAPRDVAKDTIGDKPVYRAALELTDYNLLFTRVKINGREARALIDSGSFRAIQLSSTLAQSLRLELTRTGKASRRYEGKEVYPTSGRIDSLAIGDYERRDVAIDVIEGDIENIAAQVGTKFDVILGWGFISPFHMLLDYKRLSMQFGRFSAQPPAAGASAFSLKYSVVNGAPIVRSSVGPG
ncbi:MAG: aspartyl protease family protein, partial [Blastocatellia bacterium]